MSKQPPHSTKTKTRQPEPAPARKARAATVEPSSQADAFVNYQHTGIATPENKALFRDQDYVRSLRSEPMDTATPVRALRGVTAPKTKEAAPVPVPAPVLAPEANTKETAPKPAETPKEAAPPTAATPQPADTASAAPAQPVLLTTDAPATPGTAGPGASVAEAPAPEAATESAPEIEAVPVEQATPASETAAAPDIAAPAAVEGGTGPAAAWLLQASAAAMARATTGIGQLSTNQNTVTPAATLRQQSEAAVTPPAAEEQAAANQGQVEAVSTVEVPEQDEAAAQATLHQQLQGAMPRTLEDLDEFEENNELGNVNDHVQNVVSRGTNQVQQGFGAMGQTPPPVPGRQAQPIPAPTPPPSTAALGLGTGMVQELPEELIDTSSYLNESDDIMLREGITQEQLDMVDSGDLAQANAERTTLSEEANNQPAAIRDLRRTESQNLEAELTAEENDARATMEQQRNTALQETSGEQERAKTELELRREAVSTTINQKFEDCQERVRQRILWLNLDVMLQFYSGQERATERFEQRVNRELDAFKDRRYSGPGGDWLWFEDIFRDINKFPEVKKIFDDAREAFVTEIDALIANITTYTNQVIEECKQDVEDTRAEIAEYVANLAPELQEVGNNSMAEMQQKLDDLNTRIEEEAEALNQRLAEKREEAIKAIDKKIEEMKSKLSGLLNIIGNLLLDAAKKFFTWVLEAAGLNPDEIMGFLNKGAETFMFILRQPIAFVKNLIDAAILGFNNFGGNFLKHLQDALFGWLTGSLGGIQLPSEWNLEGIMSVILQVVGIGWDAIRGKLVKLMGEPAVVVLETGFTLVQTLITDGPMAAWEQLKDMAGDMKDAFIDAIQSWIQEKIVLEAIKTIVSIFIPGAGIVKAIIAIYDTIMFFVEKAKDIIQMVGNFINSAADIAAGNIGGAADKLEGGLATALQLVINFLAKFLHLDGISEKIKKVIQKIRDKVDKALDKVVEWIKKKAKDLFGKGKDAVDAIKAWWNEEEPIPVDGGHRVYIHGGEQNPEIWVNSDPMTLETFLKEAKEKVEGNSEATTAYNATKASQTKIKGYLSTLRAKKEDSPEYLEASQAIAPAMDEMAGNLTVLFPFVNPDAAAIPPAILPPFQSGVRGYSFDAWFVSKAQLGTGQDASANNGQSLLGWAELKNYMHDTQTEVPVRDSRRNYVKMHLLHHDLGGMATDSNLVPAPSGDNSRFYSKLERGALKDIKAGQVIYYKVSVSFHSGNIKKTGYPNEGIDLSGYPSSLTAEYGLMNPVDGKYSKDNVEYKDTFVIDSIIVPEFGAPRVYEISSLKTADAWKLLKVGSKQMPTKAANFIFNNRNNFSSIEGLLDLIENVETPLKMSEIEQENADEIIRTLQDNGRLKP